MATNFLDEVYGDAAQPLAAQDLYDRWAATYDAEIAENGYVTPGRTAAALAGAGAAGPVLDLGCGTGLSGLALRQAGFEVIDGVDLSEEMLTVARARGGLYRSLTRIVAEAPLPFGPGDYGAVNAAGVISPDHAPPGTIDAVLERLAPGGCLGFSLNDHALGFAEFPAAVEATMRDGRAELVFREHGPHLPKIGLEATVYVLRRL